MRTTTIPGLKARHAIITSACREAHGKEGSFNKAICELKNSYDQHTRHDAEFHLVLVVDYPDWKKERETP